MAKVLLPPDKRLEILRLYTHESRSKEVVPNFVYKDGVAYLPLNMSKLRLVADILGETLDDQRSPGLPIRQPFTLNPAFTFRPHQEVPASKLLSHIQEQRYGVLRAPCSCGKTVVMTWTAGHLNKKTLVLVDQGNLAGQWQEAYKLVWNHDAHILGNEKDLSNDVVIATFQFLHRHPELVREMRDMFGVCLLDEFHISGAKTYRNVLFRLNNMYRIGTSATVMRKGFSSEILTDLVSDVSVQMVDDKALVPEIKFINTEVSFSSDNPNDFTKTLGALAENDQRNSLIVSLIKEQVDAGRKVLLVGSRIACLKYLHDILSKFCSATLYTGSTNLAQDRALRDGVAKGEIDVILTDKKAEKGLDLPLLDTVVIAKPMNNEATITQIVGRVLRPAAGKPSPVVYDLVDRGSLAWRFAANRYWWYRKLGYKFDKPSYFFLDTF